MPFSFRRHVFNQTYFSIKIFAYGARGVSAFVRVSESCLVKNLVLLYQKMNLVTHTQPQPPPLPTIPHSFGETTQTWDCLGKLLTVVVMCWAAVEGGREWLRPGSRWSSRQRDPPAGSRWSRRTPTCGNLGSGDMDRGENIEGTSADTPNLIWWTANQNPKVKHLLI